MAAQTISKMKWAYETSWYQDCDYCKTVALVLPSLERPGTLICENCFDSAKDESGDRHETE